MSQQSYWEIQLVLQQVLISNHKNNNLQLLLPKNIRPRLEQLVFTLYGRSTPKF